MRSPVCLNSLDPHSRFFRWDVRGIGDGKTPELGETVSDICTIAPLLGDGGLAAGEGGSAAGEGGSAPTKGGSAPGEGGSVPAAGTPPLRAGTSMASGAPSLVCCVQSAPHPPPSRVERNRPIVSFNALAPGTRPSVTGNAATRCPAPLRPLGAPAFVPTTNPPLRIDSTTATAETRMSLRARAPELHAPLSPPAHRQSLIDTSAQTITTATYALDCPSPQQNDDASIRRNTRAVTTGGASVFPLTNAVPRGPP